jgi:pSer/pThr/pTyr-binding forkhead associated (FHA) protein
MAIMDLFKQTGQPVKDVKWIRETLLQTIREQLSRLDGGEGASVKGLHLFIICNEADRHVYESAVYLDEPDRFRNEEVQRIADDYAIALPANWSMEITCTDTLPTEAVKVEGLEAGLFIRTQQKSIQRKATGVVRILNGEAEQGEYRISSADGKVNIGREKKVLGSDGFFRLNHIAFPAESGEGANKFVSRQHAHISFDNDTGRFFLYADEGGIPPRNKIKIRSVAGETPIKLHSTEVGHLLQNGDQVMLGESAVIEFFYEDES